MKNIQTLKNAPFPARERHAPGQSKGALFFKALKKLCKNPLSASGVVIVGLLLVLTIAAPMIATHDPLTQDLSRVLSAPSWAHWFGTDEYGRDIFSRVVYGSRVTLYIIFLVTIIVGPIGLMIGTMSGYFGGWVDSTFMRITDIFISFPSLVLALAFVAALGPGLEHAVIAIALTAWPPVARLARAETLTFRNADYVVAAQLQGASSFRILFHYISVMCLPSLIVRLTMNMATVILTAAALGFLGLGAQPPLPEWGAMISTGRSYMLESWWLVAFPGAAIMLVSLAFNLLGDGLRDLLDPRTD
ncbi:MULTISPECIES: nickel transporter permease [unclassified Halomonas]|uniref:nickel transporter permease n=1 Tax=unclassified Halomonas TaxID=2609666 RepID=UPI0021F73A62|nr:MULTISPECIES: nickel transporter permease [unclassified Halomonas]